MFEARQYKVRASVSTVDIHDMSKILTTSSRYTIQSR